MTDQQKQNLLKKLYNEYFDYSFAIVHKYLRNKQDVEDVVAEVFVNIWELIETIEESSAKALIFSITKRRLNDFLRRHYKFNAFSLETEQAVKFAAKADDNQLSVKKEGLMEKIENLVDQLNEKQQQVFEYKYKYKLTNTQIAEKLDISTNYVKVTNNRLLKKLKQLWQTQT